MHVPAVNRFPDATGVAVALVTARHCSLKLFVTFSF